jgi:hypothetical protein
MTLADLWLAILLAAVFVFVASSILHMVIPIHKGDYKKLAGEADVLEAMRAQGVQPGEYMFPCAGSMKEMCSPEMVEKFKQGPVGFVTVMPSGPPSMARSLVQWFLYCVLISVFAAYIGTFRLSPGAHYMEVFRLTGTVAILGYAVGNIPNSIWKGTSWGTTLKFIVDGIIYGLLTAGTFGWLWPKVA